MPLPAPWSLKIRSAGPFLGKPGDRAEFRVLVQQGGTDLRRGCRDPGIREEKGMTRLDASGALQQWLRSLNPLQGQSPELLVGQPAGTPVLVFP